MAAGVVAVLGWWLFVRDDGGSSTSGTVAAPSGGTGSTTTIAPLDSAGEDLVALLASGHDRTFHATYEATQTDGGQPREYTLEYLRDGGDVRQDTTYETEAGTFQTAGIVADGDKITCSKEPDKEWVCSVTDAGDEETDGIFTSFVNQARGQDIRKSEDSVDGRDVTCFSYGADDSESSLCVTEDGVPARLTTPTGELTLTALDDVVPDDAFDPPAEPIQAEG